MMKKIANKVLDKLWIHLTVDFITKLPLVAGENMILLVYNRLSKIMHFVAITEETLVEGLARSFRDRCMKATLATRKHYI